MDEVNLKKLAGMNYFGVFSKVLVMSFNNGIEIKELVFADENSFVIRPYNEEKLIKILEKL